MAGSVAYFQFQYLANAKPFQFRDSESSCFLLHPPKNTGLLTGTETQQNKTLMSHSMKSL